MSLTSEEKKKILKAIEEDREFRYALMGLLGFQEILDRITKLEDRFAKLEEHFMKLEERQQRLEERQQKLEERQQRLEERFAELEERFAKLEERQQRLEEEMRETRRVLITISHRFGILSEAGFREAMKYVVQELFGLATVEKKSIYDEKGIVYGYPSMIDIDVLIHDKEHILIEIKSRVSRADVYELHRVGKLYEEKYNVKPRLVIIGGFIDDKAWEVAKNLNVEIKPYLKTNII
ncbi:MAG: hypothetical protein B6U89_07235 [Desulfurococcales archaeon ex4484_58]|nr:MAG: hypothetical protein B6U89_07235 [Desulfurococcales archaeon ex4484_58]